MTALGNKKNWACRRREKAKKAAEVAEKAADVAEVAVVDFALEQAKIVAAQKVKALEGVATYGTRRAAVRCAKISWKLLHSWLIEDQEFREEFEHAVESHLDMLEEKLFERATVGIPKDDPANHDPRWLIEALRGRHPAYSKQKVELDTGGNLAALVEKLQQAHARMERIEDEGDGTKEITG